MDLFEDLTEQAYLDDPEGFTDTKEDIRGGYIPNHLSSPIVTDDCDFILNNQNFYCKRHKELKRIVEENNITKNIYQSCDDPYKCILSFINDESIDERDLLKAWEMTVLSAVTGYRIHLLNYLQNSINDIQYYNITTKISQIHNYMTNLKTELIEDYITMKKVEKIKEKLCLTRTEFGKLTNHRGLMAERDIFLFKCKTHDHSIGPTNLLLCVLDIYQSRFTLLLYFKLSDFFNKYPTSMFFTGREIIKTIESIRPIMKKDLYKFLSNWETLMIGFAINDDINDLGFSTLYTTTYEEMNNSLKNHNLKFPAILLPNSRNTDLIKLYIELTGLVKHFGHPCLDIEDGFGVVRNHGCEAKLVNQNLVHLCVGIFKRDFIKEYYNKKRRWPPLTYCPDDLQSYYENNIYPGRKMENSYSVWNQINFSKVFDYDFSPDTTELLKDSAAAADLDQWFVQYDHCAFKILYNKNKPKLYNALKPTRVIERYLSGSEQELKIKINEIEHLYFDRNDFTAVLCRKEQELNPNGRMFVKQTYIQRLLQTSMENNIAKQVMRYIPEQTMTDGEIQQMRRLTDTAKYQSRDLEIFNLDLSKWNLKFRHALVAPFGRAIDQMFGLKHLYETNHYWFLLSYVFNNSRLYPPDYTEDLEPIPGPYFYKNHLGGMEGMRQKLWTIITICIIKLAAEKSDLAIDIMCQGDNQVVMIRYRPNQVIKKKDLRERFLQNLTNDLKEVNLVLKREETWFSIRLCEFGKIRFFDGEAISAGTKKIYRMIPDINDGVCSIMSSLSTINTITESLAKYDYTPDSAFLINQFHIINYLYRKNVVNTNDHQNHWNQFLFHPSDFGGISLSTYQSHFVRGNDDKLPIWLGLFQTCKNYDKTLFNRILSINQLKPNFGEPDLRRLIEDIFSLNVQNLPSIENMFKTLALKHITSESVKNEEVKRLFSTDLSYSIDDLVVELTTMKPMILSIAHEILRNSNAGILLALRTRFTNIQTINKIVQKEHKRDFLDMMKHNNIKVRELLKKRIKYQESYFNVEFLENIAKECPSKLARNLRKLHWNIDMIGETRSNVLHQFYLKPVDFCNDLEINNSILIQLSSDYTNRRSTSYLKDGPFTAYLGSATKEKVKKPTLEMSTKTSYVKALQQLVLLKTWLKRLGSKNLVSLIDKLIQEKLVEEITEDEDLEHEDWCGMNYGGNILHRFRSIIERNSAVINFLPTIATHFKQSTNKLAGITAGGRDYTIHFQLVLLTNISRIMKLKEFTTLASPQYCAVLTCKDCTLEITDVKFDLIPTSLVIVPEPIDLYLQQEISYNITELIEFLSIHIGRQFGKSADLIFNRYHIDNKISFSTKSIPLLNQMSVNDLRYINLEFFIIGLIQQSKVIRMYLLELNPIDAIFIHSRILEPLAQFLINSNILLKMLSYLKIIGTEHAHLTSTDRISDLLLIGIYNNFWAQPNQYLVGIFRYWFKSDTLSTKFWTTKWLIKLINKIAKEEGEILNFKFNMSLFSKQKYRNNLFIKISRTLKTDFLSSRSQTLKEDDIITLFRRHPNRKIPETFERKVFPPLLRYKDYNLEEYVQGYSYFWEKVDLISNDSEMTIKDFHHIYRIKGNISTAINKIVEIIYIFQYQFMDNINNIYCLAEGSGSIIEGLGVIYPNAKLFYNTLMLPEIDPRPGPEYNDPPTIMNSTRVSLKRINTEFNLNLGNTDILSSEFRVKLEYCMSKNQPDILTIDAESSDTNSNNNFNILDKYINLIIKYRVRLGIIKYFIRENIDYEIKTSEGYQIFPFKPLTSNPCNNEIYMIILKKDNYYSLQKPLIQRFITMKNSLPIGRGFRIKTELVKLYVQLSPIVLPMINSFEAIPSPNDIFNHLQHLKICRTYCWKLPTELYKLVKTVDTYQREDYSINLLIKEGGILKLLIRIIKIISIVLLGIHNHDIFDFLTDLTEYNIPPYLRSRSEVIEDLNLGSSYDIKTLIRKYSLEQYLGIKCKCDMNINKFKEDILKLSGLPRKHIVHIHRYIDTKFSKSSALLK